MSKATRRWAKRAGYALAILYIAVVGISVEAMDRYNRRHHNEPFEYGLTYSSEYAFYLGLEPKLAMETILQDLKPGRLRLVGYWNSIEKQRDIYNFDDLDWQMDKAKAHGAKVSLSLGLRQPHYPECHYPEWARDLGEHEIYAELMPFITAVVERYKTHPALETYQLENEALLKVFGECDPFSREQLVREFELVKQLDPNHPVAVNVSNEYGLPFGKPTGDQIGFSVYRRVFDSRITHRFINYPFPPVWFRNRAAIIERYIGGEVFIHELQAEPWGRKGIRDLTVAEQDEAYSAELIENTAEFARQTGIKKLDFWGAEWWLWRKVKFNDSSVWDAAKDVFKKAALRQAQGS